MSLKTRAIGVLALAAFAAPATAAAGPYDRGADPTLAGIQKDGTFALQRWSVSDAATPGFGAATIYAPSDTSSTYGGVAFAPGWTESSSAVHWAAKRVASHGFVTIVFNVESTFTDLPPARGQQLNRALNYLVNTSAAKSRVDASRLAVSGHSMGGGGALEAALQRPSLKATVPLAPWSLNTNYASVKAPSFIVSAQNDIIAPVGSHANPFYSSLKVAKGIFEVKGGDHFVTNAATPAVSATLVSFLKRYVDEDTRYTQFLNTTDHPLAGKASRYATSGIN